MKLGLQHSNTWRTKCKYFRRLYVGRCVFLVDFVNHHHHRHHHCRHCHHCHHHHHHHQINKKIIVWMCVTYKHLYMNICTYITVCIYIQYTNTYTCTDTYTYTSTSTSLCGRLVCMCMYKYGSCIYICTCICRWWCTYQVCFLRNPDDPNKIKHYSFLVF
jgi:hypothetical protein